ncbi:MAG: aminotransferase class V-fold PLP-dependent enzyme [Planctomycetaceae bacterium]
MRRLYLDNAATTFPKPEPVCVAVDQYQRQSGAAVGRGSTPRALAAARVVERARSGLARLLGQVPADRFVFGFSGTDLLNLALQGLALQPGDKVLYTALEHNSVLRPLHHLRAERGIELIEVPATAQGTVTVDAFRVALSARPRLAVFSHASNVSGALLPVHDLVELCRRSGAWTLMDACQSAGQVPFSLRDCPVDLWVASGHKHLLGPLGTGVLYLREGLEASLRPLRLGGTGSQSESEQQPETLPHKYEAGNLNAPGLHGLAAALDWIADRGVETLWRHDQELTAQLLDGLKRIPQLGLHGPPAGPDRLGVVSLSFPGLDPQELATIWEQSFGIETRAGLHCSPRAHHALGTLSAGGTVRLSLGPFTTADDITHVLDNLGEFTAAMSGL